ncbi:MAG: metallophosphoesterase, partial [Flavisolibacter sp.]|nr:metallophosphoesterase [Flavisolibacter sp.]
MRKLLYCLTSLLLLTYTGNGQVDSIRNRIFLIGDAGDLVGDTHPVIDWLKKNVDWNDTRNTAIFLGDNIYPLGMHSEGEEGYKHDKQVIDYEISLVKGKKAKAYFIPGNHDWKNGKMGGWQQVMNEVDYINGKLLDNIAARPLNGCPGPEAIDLDDKVVLVLVDSQWFLYMHDKPGPGSGCSSKTLDEFTTQLSEIVETHKNQLLILAMHHPIRSVGVHGGAYTLRQHLFPLAEAVKGLYIPLPGLGSIYPIARGVFGNIQDVNHPQYRLMARSIEEVLKKHPNPIAVAGHDHSLQLLIKDSIPFIVSGSAAELSRIKRGNNDLLFAELSHGFSVLEVRKSGKVEVKFYDLESPDSNTPRYARELRSIAPALPLSVAVDT